MIPATAPPPIVVRDTSSWFFRARYANIILRDYLEKREPNLGAGKYWFITCSPYGKCISGNYKTTTVWRWQVCGPAPRYQLRCIRPKGGLVMKVWDNGVGYTFIPIARGSS